MAITKIRVTLETLDSAGKPVNEPLIGDVDLTPYQAGRRRNQIPKAVITKVQGMMDSLRFDGAFDPADG
jgi:hypothetical protein